MQIRLSNPSRWRAALANRWGIGTCVVTLIPAYFPMMSLIQCRNSCYDSPTYNPESTYIKEYPHGTQT